MLLLLAQLVSPPLQPGPARLPETAPAESPARQEGSPVPLQQGDLEPSGVQSPPKAPTSIPSSWVPEVKGDTPFSSPQLQSLLRSCSTDDINTTLIRCAEALTARLQQDGFINSRVFIEREPAPGQLVVAIGRLVEVHVQTDNSELESRVRSSLRGLIGQPLQLPVLQNTLQNLRQRNVVSSISGRLGKLGSDPTQAVLTINVAAPSNPWRGDISLRNDGNAGSGEWRALGVFQKRTVLLDGDILQLYGEGNTDSDPEFGAGIGSISYTLPLGRSVSLTGSFGASRRNLVEASGLSKGLSFRQYQGLGQLQWTFADNASQIWYAFAGLSANQNNSYLNGQAFPLLLGGGLDGDLTTGYLRFGLGGGGRTGDIAWSGQLYGLQGIAGFSASDELDDLAFFGINPGESRAAGAVLSAGWTMAPTLQLSLRAAGQVAFNELTNDMGFSLGSDTGLKGLPGTLISGDSGWLGSTELAWTFWQKQENALQLSPFIGMGGISTSRDGLTLSDTIGSGGILLRWLNGRHWTVELGWIDQFNAEDNSGLWNDWLLGSGLYGKIRYSF